MLTDKVSQLRTTATVGLHLADFWEKQIAEYGEAKATAFYKHLGLNHLEAKSVQWEGLTLSREPNAVEKMCVKSIASAQDAGKASVSAILLSLRNDLITDAIKKVKKLTPATYHELSLTVSDKSRMKLRDELTKIFNKGRRLVAAELSKQKQDDGVDDEDDSELDDLTDLTDSRVINDVQSRVTGAAARFTLLGLTGAALWKAVNDELQAGSVSYIDRAAQGVANKVLNFGRSSEADKRKDDWDRVEYSALLDANVCDPCAAEDGTTGASEDDLTDTPNPDCAGGDLCRCFHVWINQ